MRRSRELEEMLLERVILGYLLRLTFGEQMRN